MSRPNRHFEKRNVCILCIVVFLVFVSGIGTPVSAGAAAPAYLTQWGKTGTADGQFKIPSGIAVNSTGYVYVSENGNQRVQVFVPYGPIPVKKWGSLGTGWGNFNNPDGIAIGSTGTVYVADMGNFRVQVFSPYGVPSSPLGLGTYGTGDYQFESVADVAINSSGYIYTLDTDADRIQVFTSGKVFKKKWGGFKDPWSIAVNSSGYVYVADTGNNKIKAFTPYGTALVSWGSSGTANGQFNRPNGIAVDSKGLVYVADAGNNRIQVFSPFGTYMTKWGSSGTGNGYFNNPSAIDVNSSRYIYVVDSGNNRIQVFSKLSFLLPTVTSVSPNAGLKTGGTSVRITGTRLNEVKSVYFGKVPATNVKVNCMLSRGQSLCTSVTATSPAVIATGVVDVRLFTYYGEYSPITPADKFTYK